MYIIKNMNDDSTIYTRYTLTIEEMKKRNWIIIGFI